jgi:hypothetical protein
VLTNRHRRVGRAAARASQLGRMPPWAMLLLAAMIVIAAIEFIALLRQ